MTGEKQPSLFRLDGKSALVTGVGLGTMGHGIAVCLARQGCNVACLGVEKFLGDLRQVCDSIEEDFGVTAIPVLGDVSVKESVEAAVDEAAARLGGLDISVATVGGGGAAGARFGGAADSADPSLGAGAKSVADSDWEDYLRIVTVTQFSAIWTNGAAARHMVKQGRGGRIFFIGSVMQNGASKGAAAYSSSKAALQQVSRTMANELGGHGITVNHIKPGWIASAGERDGKGMSEDDVQRSGANVPLGRLGTPMDIGYGVAFLSSDEAEYITGQHLDIDGGMLQGTQMGDTSGQ